MPADYASQIVQYLPSGTFIAFQSIISTILGSQVVKNGTSTDGVDEYSYQQCSSTAHALAIAVVALILCSCFFLSFTDTATDTSGRPTFVLVVPWGRGYISSKELAPTDEKAFLPGDHFEHNAIIWILATPFRLVGGRLPGLRPARRGAVAQPAAAAADHDDASKGLEEGTPAGAPQTGTTVTPDHKPGPKAFRDGDLVHAVFATAILAALCLLTPPVSLCFFPGLDSVVTQAVPMICFTFIPLVFTLIPTSRDGVGFSTKAAAVAQDKATSTAAFDSFDKNVLKSKSGAAPTNLEKVVKDVLAMTDSPSPDLDVLEGALRSVRRKKQSTVKKDA